MLPEEIVWLAERLPKGSGRGAMVLNLGSSTHQYRTVMQPEIDRKIFGPLANRGYQVVHVDRKADDGVDLVGDLDDTAFVNRLIALRPGLVFCNNILMHVRPQALDNVIAGITRLVPKGSLLFASASAIYPHTSDPYDNGLRVDGPGLTRLFAGFAVVDSATIRSRASLFSDLARDRRLAAKVAIRALLPFYKPGNWLQLMRYLPKITTPYAAACAILRRV